MVLIADTIHYSCHIHANDPGKPWLLMLHGFMGSKRSFSHLTESLQSFCNPVTLDLAGHGKTLAAADPSLYSAGRQTRQVLSVIDRLAPDPLYLYGYSMGGRLAFHLLAANSALFHGALIESAHCGMLSEEDRSIRRETDILRAAAIRENYPAFVESWVKMPMFGGSASSAAFSQRELMLNQRPECMAASLLGFGAGTMPPVCGRLAELRLPIRLLAGEQDKPYAERMDSIRRLNPRFILEVIKGASHRIHHDDAEAVVHAIRRLITETEESRVPQKS